MELTYRWRLSMFGPGLKTLKTHSDPLMCGEEFRRLDRLENLALYVPSETLDVDKLEWLLLCVSGTLKFLYIRFDVINVRFLAAIFEHCAELKFLYARCDRWEGVSKERLKELTDKCEVLSGVHLQQETSGGTGWNLVSKDELIEEKFVKTDDFWARSIGLFSGRSRYSEWLDGVD